MSENSVETEELTGSIFGGDIDIDEIPDNPNHLPEGTYICRVTKAVMKKTNAGDKVGLTITYQIADGEYKSMFPFTEWLWIPSKNGEDRPWTFDETRANARLKKHFEAFGFGADEMGQVQPKDLIGCFANVRTTNRKQTDQNGIEQERINIANVSPASEPDGSDDGMSVFNKENF